MTLKEFYENYCKDCKIESYKKEIENVYNLLTQTKGK